MNIYAVRDSGPGSLTNTRYFWIDQSMNIDGSHGLENALIVTDDFRFANYLGVYYRVCQAELDDDSPFIKIWDSDPFVDFPEYGVLPKD
jgi:hypothetical protein